MHVHVHAHVPHHVVMTITGQYTGTRHIQTYMYKDEAYYMHMLTILHMSIMSMYMYITYHAQLQLLLTCINVKDVDSETNIVC